MLRAHTRRSPAAACVTTSSTPWQASFAIEDFSALRYVRERVLGTAFFQSVDLIADPDDPRDLFGMLQRAKG